MESIKWRESFETGIPSMDDQHQQLFELINKLYKVIRNHESNDSLKDVLDEMNRYTDLHLNEEEAVLESHGYADLNDHKQLHQNYRERVRALMDESLEGNEQVLHQTYKFLRTWWMDHIVSEDKKYGEFLKAKGVQ